MRGRHPSERVAHHEGRAGDRQGAGNAGGRVLRAGAEEQVQEGRGRRRAGGEWIPWMHETFAGKFLWYRSRILSLFSVTVIFWRKVDIV